MANKNPNCDGAWCSKPDGEVRKLPCGGGGKPYGGGSNLIYCYDCYCHEIEYREEFNKRNADIPLPFALPYWESLEIYKGT